MKNLIAGYICLTVLVVTLSVSAAEPGVPIVASPVAPRTTAPTAALPAHAKRIGAVYFDMAVLRPDLSSPYTKFRPPEAETAWLTPRLYLQLFPDIGIEASGLRIEQDDFGNTTWIGTIEGIEDGIVLLTKSACCNGRGSIEPLRKRVLQCVQSSE